MSANPLTPGSPISRYDEQQARTTLRSDAMVPAARLWLYRSHDDIKWPPIHRARFGSNCIVGKICKLEDRNTRWQSQNLCQRCRKVRSDFLQPTSGIKWIGKSRCLAVLRGKHDQQSIRCHGGPRRGTQNFSTFRAARSGCKNNGDISWVGIEMRLLLPRQRRSFGLVHRFANAATV